MGKCGKASGCGDHMIRGQCETWEQSQMNLNKFYQKVLIYESVILMKRLTSMNTLIKVLKVNAYSILMMKWELI